jgi:deazaflavin-dependent oxidoreductase (nitroreductase family)
LKGGKGRELQSTASPRRKEIKDERKAIPSGHIMADSQFMRNLASTNEVEITVTGRKSGSNFSTPVWFIHEGAKLYLVPVRGSDSNWYKNVVAKPTMHVSARGKKIIAKGNPISDPQKVADVVEKLRSKYGAEQVEKYYSKLDAAIEVAL